MNYNEWLRHFTLLSHQEERKIGIKDPEKKLEFLKLGV
jgi:hypothetical protein